MRFKHPWMTAIAFGLVLSLSACLMPTRVVSFPTSTSGAEVALPSETLPAPATATVEQATTQPQATATATRLVAPTASATQTATPTATEAATQAPTETQALPVASDTPEPAATPGELLLRAKMDTNCREGPGPDYEIIGSLVAGETSRLAGRSAPAGWWYIENPSFRGFYCWVWGVTTEVEGDTSTLPYVKPPAE